MSAAACIEVAEFNECLEATRESEQIIYTGSLLQCTPSLETYIKRFKEAKELLHHSEDPEAIWTEKMSIICYRGEPEASAHIIREKRTKAQKRDIKTLECVKEHHTVQRMQHEEDEQFIDSFVINGELYKKADFVELEREHIDYGAYIDTWATGIKTNISDHIYILSNQIDDTISEISYLNNIINNPRIDALAKGLEQMYLSYLSLYWIEEQAKIELKIELLLREYDEEDTEGITHALLNFYKELKEKEKPDNQDDCFVQLWHKHLSKNKTPENYLSLAKAMLFNWNTYIAFFKDGLLLRCFYEIQMDEYISYELRDLRKAQKHKAKDSKGKLTDVLNTELARDIFAECLKKGWMHETENGYHWEGIPEIRGRVAQLVYLCGKIYGFKYSDKLGRNVGAAFPDSELCKLFNVKDMEKQLVQVYQAVNKQIWRAIIDKLFE